MLRSIVVAAIVLSFPCLALAELPEGWLKSWRDPAAADRPLQIVHGIPGPRANLEGMRYYRDLGLGGVVCNVAFDNYLRSEDNWRNLVSAIEACKALGLVVWLYDEEGYPSGEAGGLVLEKNPEYEAIELAYDPSQPEPFMIRPSYEHAHAANNYHAARRCPNLIDDRAMRSFIELTHEAYRQRLGGYFGDTIHAMFTDEPSLMAVNLGQLPESVRQKVRVVDPLDPAVKPLPSVPWSYDLPERYRDRFGEDLAAQQQSLFTGDTESDRRVRRQFWSLIADLIAERYFGAIQDWCRANQLAASGHTLHEHSIIHHVPLEGNAIKVLSRMDIPGLDMLSSEPLSLARHGWLTPALPSSAAMLNGRRRVMTEVSDFSQKMGNAGPASLADMQATAAWQAVWGVTDFTLYYSPRDRSEEDYRAYGEYVGRLNAVLKPASLESEVLLYYPIYDLWAEYLPVGKPLDMASQSARARQIVESFNRLGTLLSRAQVPFGVIDHEHLIRAAVERDGHFSLGGHRFHTLVLPAGVELPAEAAAMVDRLRQAGGRVIEDGQGEAYRDAGKLADAVRPTERFVPSADGLVLGRFVRDRRRVLLMLNAATTPYSGRLDSASPGAWTVLNPASGEISPATKDGEGRITIELGSRQALLLVEDTAP